ncbi:hypothetical protein [Wolbachia endosymbiont (group A) of Sicus ferrugineus]|nr:hypothetical protein [Wolbachia endosymbiont (group A) of Sicus ferrugineus]
MTLVHSMTVSSQCLGTGMTRRGHWAVIKESVSATRMTGEGAT